MALYKVESNSKNIYFIQKFVTVMAGLIMDIYIYIYMFIHNQHTCINLQSYNVDIMM